MKPKLEIVIVNWNSGSQLADSISSIAKYHHNLVLSVIVVDNASYDDSLIKVKSLKNLPFRLQLICNSTNKGFGVACNQGAALASSEYLLFLNPDTRLFQNSLPAPHEFMQNIVNVKVGIVGIQLLDTYEVVTKSCSRFPNAGMFIVHALGINRLLGLTKLTQQMVDWDHSLTRQVDQVMGAFFFIRHSLFKSLGGFDERFYVYFEEVDLSFRAKQNGWNSVYIANAQAYHSGGGVSNQVKAHRLFYSLRSRILYSFKHFNRPNAVFVLFVTLLVEPISRSVHALVRCSINLLAETWRGYYMLYLWLIQWAITRKVS